VKKTVVTFVLGALAGAALVYALLLARGSMLTVARVPPEAPPVCYSCFWQGYDPKLRSDLIDFYRQFRVSDPLLAGDVEYILWRAGGMDNCSARVLYRQAASQDPDGWRKLRARAALGFSAAECGYDGSSDLRSAAALASDLGLASEARLLGALSRGRLQPEFADTEIGNSLVVPPQARGFVLGESEIEVRGDMRIGAQVDRVARDWLSFQMRWNMSGEPLPVGEMVSYHEGAIAAKLAALTGAGVYPLGGVLLARHGELWVAPDETGRFRFEVTDDKLQYPTSHAHGDFAWLADTHGVSALVPQALERGMQLVIGCGDSAGKAQAAYYLAAKGVHVHLPGDRHLDLLLGHDAPGVILGTAPLQVREGKILLGGQPVRFSLREPFVVQDTKQIFPLQYYDAPARYFRRLAQLAQLDVHYVLVERADELHTVLEQARRLKSSAVGVRIATEGEQGVLRRWLAESAQHRAVLFHSGLYPFAQALFEQFPQQVTFGDLRPRFE
jgi:hypothetical protein